MWYKSLTFVSGEISFWLSKQNKKLEKNSLFVLFKDKRVRYRVWQKVWLFVIWVMFVVLQILRLFFCNLACYWRSQGTNTAVLESILDLDFSLGIQIKSLELWQLNLPSPLFRWIFVGIFLLNFCGHFRWIFITN